MITAEFITPNGKTIKRRISESFYNFALKQAKGRPIIYIDRSTLEFFL